MPQSYARPHAPIMSRLSCAAFSFTAALTGALAFWAMPAAAQSADAAPHLPDMASYNCAAAAADTTATVRHIGQFIQGQYYEWHEIYVLTDAIQRLACISLLRPTPRQLGTDEAKTFLTNALAIGFKAATSPDFESSQDTGSAEPDNVQPEPLKRVRQPAASSGSAEQKSSILDLEPIPATKTFDGANAPATIKPTPEHSSAITQEAPTALAYEQPQTVGVEDRTQIANTQVFPWTTLAYLSVTYPNGENYRCSATLVSPYVVLTAGHCVHNNNRGGYIISARVYPGQTQAILGDNNPMRPYGFKSDISAIQTTSQWTQISGEDSYVISSYRHDFAALEFKTAFTHTGTFMPVLYGSTGTTVTSAGYPGVYNNATAYGLYTDSGDETNQSLTSLHSVHVREFKVDASGGNSGGPFFYVDPGTGQRYLVGSLSYAEDLDDQAGGPWYDSWNQALVSSWVTWTPNSVSTGTVSGLRVGSVFSSALPNITSYLRFYNAGTTSGTVDVTLADYATGNVLATWTSPSIAGHRTRQFAMSEIENNASATFTKPAVYSLSVRPTFTGNFQNTLWNNASLFLGNTSTCDTTSTDQKTLIYVHSSLLAPYTSTIVVHNTGTTAISPTLGIYNGETGERMTGYTTDVIPANGQSIIEIGNMEKAASINLGVKAYHYNIIAETNFTGYMQQFLKNQNTQTVNDMTASCAMTP